MSAPVRHRLQFGRHLVERRAFRRIQPPRIAVIAAADLDRRSGEEAAGVETDIAERIVVNLEAAARRLSCGGARDRRRDRRGSSRRRRRGNGRIARPDKFRLRRAGIGLRSAALAIEGIKAGVRRTRRGGNGIDRRIADTRRRPAGPELANAVSAVIGGNRPGWVRACRRSGSGLQHQSRPPPSTGPQPRQNPPRPRAFRARDGLVANKQGAALQARAATFLATRPNRPKTATNLMSCDKTRHPADGPMPLTELKQLWLMSR